MTASERFKRWEESGWANCEVPNSAFLVEALDLLEKKEAGLIIELPVPIGAEVWTCYDYDDGRGCVVRKDSMFSLNCLSIVSAWGNRVFSTREEAEAKLKELRGEK